MIEIFNRLQQIFGRPITLVDIDEDLLSVSLDWWGKGFLISRNLTVYDLEQRTYMSASANWIAKLLQGAKRNDAGELVQQCES